MKHVTLKCTECKFYYDIFLAIFNDISSRGSLLVLSLVVVLECILGVKVSITQVASVLEGPAEMKAFHMFLQVITLAAFELTNSALEKFEPTLITWQFDHILIEVTP